MAVLPKFHLGKWYEARKHVRKPANSPAKGIFIHPAGLTIISSYHGARRRPYDDELNLEEGYLAYVGHGRTGDQDWDFYNALMTTACIEGADIYVFLDCGDLFTPKRLLFAGSWRVSGWQYLKIKQRWVFLFRLYPCDRSTLVELKYILHAGVVPGGFDRALRSFANKRESLYAKYPYALRARDNIAAEVGEFLAIRFFNAKHPTRPLFRLRAGYRDIDAIQAGSSNGIAIKATTQLGRASSNIWTDIFDKRRTAKKGEGPAISHFLIIVLTSDLRPVLAGMVKPRHLKLYREKHQGSLKFVITRDLVLGPHCERLYVNERRLRESIER